MRKFLTILTIMILACNVSLAKDVKCKEYSKEELQKRLNQPPPKRLYKACIGASYKANPQGKYHFKNNYGQSYLTFEREDRKMVDGKAEYKSKALRGLYFLNPNYPDLTKENKGSVQSAIKVTMRPSSGGAKSIEETLEGDPKVYRNAKTCVVVSFCQGQQFIKKAGEYEKMWNYRDSNASHFAAHAFEQLTNVDLMPKKSQDATHYGLHNSIKEYDNGLKRAAYINRQDQQYNNLVAQSLPSAQ